MGGIHGCFVVLWRVYLEHGGVGISAHGPECLNLYMYTLLPIDYRQTHTHTIIHTPISKNSLSSVWFVVVYCAPPPPSLNPYLPTSMFISLRGPRGACERLVKEHGMLMAWKGYE